MYKHSNYPTISVLLYYRKVQLFAYGLYCDFTKFDAEAEGHFDPSSLSGLTELDLSSNELEGAFPQVRDSMRTIYARPTPKIMRCRHSPISPAWTHLQ